MASSDPADIPNEVLWQQLNQSSTDIYARMKLLAKRMETWGWDADALDMDDMAEAFKRDWLYSIEDDLLDEEDSNESTAV